MSHALVVATAVDIVDTVMHLHLASILLADRVAVEQVGEVQPAGLALPRHDPGPLLLLEGAGRAAGTWGAAARRCAAPLAAAVPRSVRAQRGRQRVLSTPLGFTPAGTPTANAFTASGVLRGSYARALNRSRSI
jgi:hypothetical protein